VPKAGVIGLALTWDGARWPVRSLPEKARAFLGGATAPKAKVVAALLTKNEVEEIRVCWVPRLKGGGDVLSEPFLSESGKRRSFRCVKTTQFGEVLGVVYRK